MQVSQVQVQSPKRSQHEVKLIHRPSWVVLTGNMSPKFFSQVVRGFGTSRTFPVTDIRTPDGSVTIAAVQLLKFPTSEK